MVLARQMLKADLRQPITAWKALVWAYADQHVRMATNNEGRLAENGFSQMGYSDVGHGSGAINGWLDAHEDALLIDVKTRAWFSVGKNFYGSFAMAVERRRRPAQACELPPLHAVPVRRVNGTIKEEYIRMGRHDTPAYCLVDWEGCDAAELAAAQMLYDLFVAFLDIMPQLKLSKWRIEGTGLDTSDRIIDKALKPVTG